MKKKITKDPKEKLELIDEIQDKLIDGFTQFELRRRKRFLKEMVV